MKEAHTTKQFLRNFLTLNCTTEHALSTVRTFPPHCSPSLPTSVCLLSSSAFQPFRELSFSFPSHFHTSTSSVVVAISSLSSPRPSRASRPLESSAGVHRYGPVGPLLELVRMEPVRRSMESMEVSVQFAMSFHCPLHSRALLRRRTSVTR